MRKYKPVTHHSRLTKTECPAARMANGTTHFKLYIECIAANEPICIVEHDAIFVGKVPAAVPHGVIQISSHVNRQATRKDWEGRRRAQRMKLFEPTRKVFWIEEDGVVHHPLSGTNGTSGYIIHPNAAQRMIDYIRSDGVAFGDRVRTERIGEGNLYLQKPQSVICDHKVRSCT